MTRPEAGGGMQSKYRLGVRDALLTRIGRFEEWLEATGSRWYRQPLKAVGFLFLILALLVTNLAALVLWLFGGVGHLFWRRTAAAGEEEPAAPRKPEAAATVTSDAPPARASGLVMEAGPSTLEALLRERPFLLLDFWAAWCGPCMLMKPALRRLAQEAPGDLAVAAVDASRHPGLVKDYAVRGLPTLVLFQDGREVKRHTGALSHGKLRSFVAEALDSTP